MTMQSHRQAAARSLSFISEGDVSPALGVMPDHVLLHHRLSRGIEGLGDTVVVDVDLERRDNVLCLREAWSRLGQPQRLIFVVDRADHFAATQANALGAHTLLQKPFDPQALVDLLYPKANPGGALAEVLRAVAGGAAALESLFSGLMSGMPLAIGELEEASAATRDSLRSHGLYNWLDAVRQHHSSTFQHCLIVTGVITNFAQSTGMSRGDALSLTTAGFLHDIGKIRIPLTILDKPGALTSAEFDAIKRHPAIGFDYLKGESAIDGEVLSSVRHHHEYLDGSGYPDGLSGSAIDDVTRILTICDVYGALVETRSYRPAMQPDDAMSVLHTMVGAGKLEAPLVHAFARSVGTDPA